MILAPASELPRRARSARRLLMIGCAVGAVLVSGEAAAQSFDATPTVTHGSATITTPPGQTNVNVASPSAVIVWRPLTFGDPTIFQPAGTTATFTGGPGFAVLNRILAQGRVQFDGTVLSRVGSVPGGTVAFSAPNGIIIGGTAVFDVGRLILTTLDPVVSPAGQFIDATGAIDFQPGVPGASVVTLAGSRITALEEGSYVLMAAPRVEHGGSVLTNGSTAYVAANSAVVRHTSGLFDIFVTSGTTVATPLVHTGRTGGPASTGGADRHNIYMAAVSEDLAITALVGGTVGYDSALSATVENGAIILSAFSLGGGAGSPATLSLGDGTYTSDLVGFSSHNAAATGTATYSQDLSLIAGGAASVTADGSVIQIGGNLALVARDPSDPLDPIGGTATLEALNGGRVEVTGSATVDAAGITTIPFLGDIFTDAIGGTAQVLATGGTVTVGGNLRVNADGRAVTTEAIPDDAGSGFGGSVHIAASESGSITVAGNLEGTARASSQQSRGTTPTTATGGSVTVETRTGGRIDITGTTRLATDARVGTHFGDPGPTPGLARGGIVRVDVLSGQINLGGATSIDTRALGGDGAGGGDAIGGAVTIQAQDGSIQLADGSSVDTSAEGGSTFARPGGNGGNGTAGDISIIAASGTTGSSIAGAGLTLTAQGRGGTGGGGQGAVQPGVGGTGSGGVVVLQAGRRGGQIQFGEVRIDGRGIGGDGGGGDAGQNGANGGDGFGSAFVSVGTRRESPATGGASDGELTVASLDVDAIGEGGRGGVAGGAGATGGTGGRGQGGAISLASEGAPTTVTGLARLAAEGIGGAGGLDNGGTAGVTGTARGGELVIVATTSEGNAGSLSVGALEGSLDARGDDGTANQGGYFRVIADNSPIVIESATILNSVTGNPAARQPSDIITNGGLLAVSTSGLFQSDGDLRISAAGAGGIEVGSLSFQSNGNISVEHSARPTSQTTVGGTQLSFDAAQNFTASSGTLIRGATGISVFAEGVASFGDLVAGEEISVTSSGIEILDTGRIGEGLTQFVRLAALNPGARIGGENVGSGYVLSAAEAGRITGTELRISVPAASGPANRPADIVVRDLTLDANRVRQFGINTQGIVQVEGALLLSNAQPSSFIEIGGDPRSERIQVITPSGSIRVRNGSGAPAGTVRLDATDIWVTDQALFNQLIVDPNFAGRNAALLANSGAVNPRGYIEAFDVVLSPLRSLYVQNSGTATDFGGITVGSSTLTINAGAPGAPADVAVFARGIRADGTMSTGSAFFLEAVYNGTYTAGSELNLCNIPTRTCPAPPPPPEPEQPDFGNPAPTSEEVEEPVGGGDRNTPLQPFQDEEELIDTAAAEPLIEEPVTSGGDSSAWTEGVEEQCQAGDQERALAEGREVPRCTPPSREPADE
ncbi:beta strand repeat-containing protein [Allosphingosinicella sp.]|uniref:beta strand repeat-containing protein n=1 Tax=Allosphingosinicella sp. TaxID=2823234 RepID=UPI003D73775A